jgi:hypothetical protein
MPREWIDVEELRKKVWEHKPNTLMLTERDKYVAVTAERERNKEETK